MRKTLGKYSKHAKLGLILAGSLMASLGMMTAPVAVAVIGASLAFGGIFWQIWDFVKVNGPSNIPLELLNSACVAIGAVLVGLGYADMDGATLLAGGAGIFTGLVGFWTVMNTVKEGVDKD